jgi:hypothetical protein
MVTRIEDLPQHLQAQARAQLGGRPAPLAVSAPAAVIVRPLGVKGRHVPNKTEVDYQRRHLAGLDARYECVTFRMANGHRYTPDWVVFADGRPVACHECKGGYALHSQQRARLAFDQARIEFPGLGWVWAVKMPAGWQVETL